MTYVRFREILKEEGLDIEEIILEIWENRPYDNLPEWKIRETTQWLVNQDEYKSVCTLKNMLEKETGPGLSDYRTPPGGESS